MPDLDEILAQRGQQNGDYGLQCEIEQEIKKAIYSADRDDLTPYMRSSLDMIAHKLARIATGDVWHEDHWMDIQGYAKLTSDRVKLRNASALAPPPINPDAPRAPSANAVENDDV